MVGLAPRRQSGDTSRRISAHCDCHCSPVQPTHLGPLIPIQAKPAQRPSAAPDASSLLALGVNCRCGTRRLPPVLGVGQIEQRGADQRAEFRWVKVESDPDCFRGGHGFPLRTTGLVRVPIPSMVIETVSPSRWDAPQVCRWMRSPGSKGHYRRDPFRDGADVLDHQRGAGVLFGDR